MSNNSWLSKPTAGVVYLAVCLLGYTVGRFEVPEEKEAEDSTVNVAQVEPLSNPQSCYAPDVYVNGKEYSLILNLNDPSLIGSYGEEDFKNEVRKAGDSLYDLLEAEK